LAVNANSLDFSGKEVIILPFCVVGTAIMVSSGGTKSAPPRLPAVLNKSQYRGALFIRFISIATSALLLLSGEERG
jgi:hypothetical protein